MASSSSTYRSSSSSDGGNNNPSDSVVTVDERKRKRMLSNRESARRSRMRKQKHVDDLTAQINQLSNDNRQILNSLTVTSQLYMKIQAENSVLTAQMEELSTRLQSLNEIVDLVQSNGAGFGVDQIDGCGFDDRTVGIDGYYDDMNMMSNVNHWGGSVYTNQPIMANDINMY
ncbi:BZIP transcription factor 2 [Arabidopsis thaliana]|uniref:bZIP transcription factor 2 n=4 Tax=Arabidopsis TaxID=3701 RepID=BZIP2_ARATH|nr:basic leucine-zipper 2 [Arabidopsis thaliana]Q9SI15.1 RecName: Full=bZIP transcription factor 2; Short=AtbZIP2; AltName: Full=G-box-binding factor 5; AltName: Full=Protein FLORAL TRANSITION AT THE MERISTEM 3 [Arabidopsis thaliana]KAG7636566.1 Basic-leucine zipper domain [Arabidopsis thaliana x Arabidopsis arenosa]KAG7641188.1 Basic-leucine zipper domain [Arabidopsis suecica]AAD31350.1 putative bZIP transcription factor [Arabidopsis thaliana]AAK59801.1 At2g18160/F8D23.6 [Arabidopsis thaliana|eukprot:NP_179408.1 basic leucine-zipper 2 [Arabidopsis thaliana]